MRFLLVAASIAVLSVATGNVHPRWGPGQNLVDSATWKVASESDDHITYVRRPVEPTTTEKDVDCNKTTTTPAPVRRSSTRSRYDMRSGVEGGRRAKSSRTTSPKPMNYDGGDHLWEVSHKTDDHITYTRRGSSSQGQDQDQGLGQGHPGVVRWIGTGRDSVLARVVVPGKEQEYTEEAIVEGAQPGRGHTTNELVHPYVRKTKASSTTTSTSTSARSQRTKSLKTGRRQTKSQPAPAPLTSTHEDHPPRIGEVVNGWVVVNKTKDSISWDRWGTSSSSSPPPSAGAAAVAHQRARNTQNENRLRSLKSSRGSAGSRGKVTGGKQLIPNQEGQLVEGFPRVFNTYSRAFYVNERNVDAAGSIRTSMSDTRNWNVGDELAGWVVISKDHRGIVWQRKPAPPAPSAAPGGRGGYVINEEDLLEELNKNQEEESSESDSSSDSESNEGDSMYPPGTWYLAKETKNSITWKRDNTPADVIFEMNAYPRVGDVQSGWKVQTKSRGHITWVRINSDGSEIESNENEA